MCSHFTITLVGIHFTGILQFVFKYFQIEYFSNVFDIVIETLFKSNFDSNSFEYFLLNNQAQKLP